MPIYWDNRVTTINEKCCMCGKPAQFYSEAGYREFGISGLCEFCFDLCDPDVCKHCGKPKSWHIYKKVDCANFELEETDDETPNYSGS